MNMAGFVATVSELVRSNRQELQGFAIIVSFISGVIAFGPLTGNKILPVSVRISIAISIALPLYGIRFGEFTSVELVGLVFLRAIHGSMVGWSASLIFHAFQSAGRIIDDTRGMAQVTLLDPSRLSYTSQSGMLLFLLVSILFFYSGAYRLFLIALLNSSTKTGFMLPPFSSMLSGTVVPFFYATVLFSLPFCITFFLTEIASGILNRSVPSLNVYFLLHQAKILLGLFVLITLLYNIENIKIFFFNYFSQTLFLTKF
jgi:flagellar biosynthetic protein FliR